MLDTLRYTTHDVMKEILEEKKIRKTNETFLLFSLGSQFDHLIKLSLEKLGVFCLVADPATIKAEDVKKVSPKGIILSGGPVSIYKNPPPFDREIFDIGIPTLGICLGFQLWAKHIGVPVVEAGKREFGVHALKMLGQSPLFEGCQSDTQVLESHGDRVKEDPRLLILASTANAPVAAARYKHLWGVQFHPEVTHTVEGAKILENFCVRICHARDRYPAPAIAKKKIDEIKKKIEDKFILLALSGGSDSSVVAYLLRHAVSEKYGQIRAVYIRGIDRPDDEAHVLRYFGGEHWLELKIVDGTDKFLAVLRGKSSMREKRLSVREVYKSILEDEACIFDASFIAQGTLYTDISESGFGYASGARKAEIKIHHNVNLDFAIPELTPLDDSVKDGARNIGREIGVPEELLTRHPFPGPGLVVRIEGEVDRIKLRVAREADKIFVEELRRAKLYETLWQAGATATESVTTCTKGDDAAEGLVVALWAVWSVNGFTAEAAELPYEFLKHVATRMTNEVSEVGAVTYRISGKPPATIEWG